MMKAELLIIGAGPGGYETAVLAAEKGLQVVIVESGEAGGTCLNRGCIPTKSFCRNAAMLEELRKAEDFGVIGLSYGFDFHRVTERKNAVVSRLRTGVETLLGHKNITLVRGKARFVAPKAVEVTLNPHSGVVGVEIPFCRDPEVYEADNIIIATGSVPAFLPVPGCDLPGVVTSTEMLDMDEVPGRLCVIGGGVIGLELASVFRSFGSEVTILEFCPEILPRFDADVAKRLRQSLGKRGIDIITKAQVTGIAESSGALSVRYLRKGKEESAEADKVLMAVGRRPNLHELGLDAAGIGYTPKGIVTDNDMLTNLPGVYAIGDVNGRMMLAHAATAQGRKALNHILGIADMTDLNVMPSAVFTIPEAASVGLTAEDCAAQGLECREYKSFFRSNGKAVCMGETDGFCKIVTSVKASGATDSACGADSVCAVSETVVGCHLYGPHAADLIAEMTAVISCRASLEQFRSIIHAHPTLSEVLGVCR